LCCQDECQELLTIEDAVKIALENNYAIKIAANELGKNECIWECRYVT
jgi:hypothetical protein